MSLETVATTAFVTPITERLIGLIWDNSGRHVYYLTKFKDNHNSLMIKMSELRGLRDHVKRRIQVHEASQQLKRTPVVAEWLHRVEAFDQEVDVILRDCSRDIEQRCCGDYCPQNWWRRYRLCKKVNKKLKSVSELISHGNFDVVADKCLPSQLQLRPENLTIGMDEIFREARNLIGQDEVKIIGIYGMGGIGKTTLLKKINNAFLHKHNDQDRGNTFDVVIWVLVSREFNIRNIQKDIAERLGLAWTEGEDQKKRAEHIFNLLSKKKFLVLLDDMWQAIELETIGIPSPHINQNNSKIVFTTRSEKVCGDMEVNKKLKMPVLDWDQSWILFQLKLGEDALNCDLDIPELAKAVARECHGLPLALITIGRAMSSKNTPPEWNHAVKTLKKYASEFSGMEEKVLSILKFSYDSLEDDTARDCFLYFSLYPEGYDISISDIVYRWIGEGFLDNFEDMDDALDKGHDIIGILKAACLLETGYREELGVKMHDVVRDLAFWIARECGKNNNKVMVQAGVGLTQAPNMNKWEYAERISLMRNGIQKLSGVPKCPCLLTLMLQYNNRLSIIPDNFFQYMPALRVLNLSHTRIRNVPKSIGCLFQLQYLNLHRTEIQTLPDELGNLVKLEYLNLYSNRSFSDIPNGIISCFPRLQVLYVGRGFTGNHTSHGAIEADLECLQHLRVLGITIETLPFFHNMIHKLRSSIGFLGIVRCQGLSELTLVSSSLLGDIKCLRSLTIQHCLELKKVAIDSVNDEKDMKLLLNLERLNFRSLPKLNIVWTERVTHLHFKHLSYVKLYDCGAVKDISWLLLVPFLRKLVIKKCKEVEEIICDRFTMIAKENQNSFSRVWRMEFSDLPKLKSIISGSLPFPSLMFLIVSCCPLLKKLPFTFKNTNNSLLKIRGDTEWWNELQWEDETEKSFLQSFFIANK